MSDQIEAATEALPKTFRIQATGIPALAVFSLATYGAQNLTRKGYTKAKQIRANRKAKKAAQKAETDSTQ